MGYTIKNLATRKVESKSIFSTRFVCELAEEFHVHYRNMRIIISMSDFKDIANGFINSLKRWGARGKPEPKEGTHIELCRKKIANDPRNDGIQINLNKNLYNLNKETIFSDGAEFTEDEYIHLKIRDIRLEMSIDEFKLLTSAVKEAEGVLSEC